MIKMMINDELLVNKWYTMTNEDESWWSRMMIYNKWWRMQSRIRVQVSTTQVCQILAAAAKILSTTTDTIAQTYAIFMINDNEWWWIIKNDRCWWMMNDDEWWMMINDYEYQSKLTSEQRITAPSSKADELAGSPRHHRRPTSNQP